MVVMISRNTTLQTKITQKFTTFKDKQTAVTISVFEGERGLAKDNNFLGEFELQLQNESLAGVP